MNWFDAKKEKPPIDEEVLCKVKGIPFTTYHVLKWDGQFWWIWVYYNEEINGWSGLCRLWEVLEWQLIDKKGRGV